MKRVLALLIVLGTAGWAAAQSTAASDPQHKDVIVTRIEYDMRQLLTPPPVSEAVLKGRKVWVQRCAVCHDGVGMPTYDTPGPWLDSDTLKSLGEARVRQLIAKGSARMPGFELGLQPAQVDQLLAFLGSVPPGQRPPRTAAGDERR